MVKDKDDSRSQRLIELAQEIEKRVDSRSEVMEPSPSNGDEEKLDEPDREELKRFEGALSYLRGLRSNIEINAKSESVKKDFDSTKSNLNGSSSANSLNPSTLRHPNQLGRFEIEKILGQGGFARVFLARDSQLDRRVALKVPKPTALLSEEAQSRFEREARAAAVLSHPNIVPVFESGSVGPIHYIASGYCAGPTLAEWFEKNKRDISIRLAVEIVTQLADAVQHAHQRGVVHRDLKPGNILLESDQSTQVDVDRMKSSLRITDFGLAKCQLFEDQTLTREGAILGTPAYMSPEQARADAAIDSSTDIYSLGVILYELLTGKLPCIGNNHIETLQAVAQKEPPSLRKCRRAIPSDLEAICMKSLSKSKSNRYQSAFDFQQDLQSWLQGFPVEARRATSLDRAVRWCRRNPLLAAAIFVAFASLVTGLSLTIWQWRESQANLAATDTQRIRAIGHLGQLEDTVDYILEQYGNQLEENQALDKVQKQILDRMLVVHRSLLQEEPDHLSVSLELVENYNRVVEIFRLLGEYEQSRKYLNTALQLIAAAPDSHSDHEKLQKRRYQLLFTNFLIDYEIESPRRARRALNRLKPLLEDDQFPFTKAERLAKWHSYYRHLFLANHIGQEYELAELACLKAVEYLAELMALEPDNPGWNSARLRATLDLALVNWGMNRRDRAVRHYEQVIDDYEKLPIEQQLLGPNLQTIADCRSTFGQRLERLGRPNESRQQLGQAITVFEKLFEINPKSSRGRYVHTLNVLGGLCRKQEWFEQAVESCDKALAVIDTIPSSRFQTQTHMALLVMKGDLVRLVDKDSKVAKQYLDKAIRIGDQSIAAYSDSGAHYTQMGRAYFYLGQIQIDAEQFDEAMKVMSKAFEYFALTHQRSPFRSSPKNLPSQVVAFQSDQALARGDFGAAVLCWDKLTALAPEESRFYFEAASHLTKSLDSLSRSSSVDENAPGKAQLKTAALNNLKKALKRGFDRTEVFNTEPSWKVLKDSTEFQEILSKLSK